MPSRIAVRVLRVCGIAALVLCAAHDAWAQLNENCTVSVLNRTVRVNPDGSWVLTNVPANFGQVRARATCVRNGQTVSGESGLFAVPSNGAINLQPIVLGQSTPIPVALTIAPATHTLTQPDATVQLAVSARYADGTVRDVTAASTGTQYTISNTAIATLTGNGLVQVPLGAISGTVVIQATHEGASGLTSIQVLLGGASHGGIPDSWAVANGLNPNDPAMPFEDPDRDGLTNLAEFQRGTDPHKADTDGDGLPDGQEVAIGTNPLLADTDGDGVRDGLEAQTGSDPLNAASLNLAQALNFLVVGPSSFVLTFNTILGEASRQLTVTGNLKDGTTIDLVSIARGTNYSSSDLNICNFGADPGRVFAGQVGTCTITVTNSGFQAIASGTIRTFAPAPLSFVSIPGFAHNVDVSGNFAYVAAGTAGLVVVDVSDRRSPRIVATLDTPGNTMDVKVVGDHAFLADGPSGLQIIDVSTPTNPRLLGSLDTPGDARDVVLSGNQAFVADGGGGLQIINIASPSAPSRTGSLDSSGAIFEGVDVAGNLAVIASMSGGIKVVDVADPTRPSLIGQSPGGEARDIVLRDNFAFVADTSRSFTTVDLSDPRNPVVRAATPRETGGLLHDVAQSGRFVFGADFFFVNGVPIIDVSVPANPVPRAILDFRNFRDDEGSGIAVDSSFVYLTANRENGRLYIGQYLALEDTAGVPPTVRITAPAAGDSVIEGTSVSVTVDATDDIQVVSVDFLVDGRVVFTDTAAPYQFTVAVPTGMSSLTLGARAVDLGSNSGTAQEVRLDVTPDPGTTVVGRVIDSNQNPVADTTVLTFGQAAISAADGTFSIASVPTIQGNITVSCSAIVNGQVLTGFSTAFPPVRGGTTNVGNIVLRACVPAPGGLVSWWRAEGNANDFQGDNHGTLIGGATFAPGKAGQAFSFNGTSSYVEIPNRPNLNFGTGSFTVEAWVQYPTLSQVATIAAHGASGSVTPQEAGWHIGLSSGHIQVLVKDQLGDTALFPNIGAPAPAAGQFHHVAMVLDRGANLLRLYVNGTQVSNAPLRAGFGSPNNNGNPAIGAHNRGGAATGGVPTTFFNGQVDEFAIYNRALSASEIQAIHNAGSAGKCEPSCTPAPSGLVSWWSGEGNANDVLGGNHGTLQNGATFAAGKVAQAFSFDGIDDLMRLPNTRLGPLDLTGSQVSIEGWVFHRGRTSVSNAESIFDKYCCSPGQLADGYIVFIDGNGRLGFLLATTINRNAGVSSPQLVPTDTWVHVAATYDGTMARLYMNGSQVADAAVTGTLLHNDFDATIGNDNGGSPAFGFHGTIDELAVYNRALTAAEIQAIFNSNSAGKCGPNTVASITLSPSLLSLSAGALQSITATARNSSGQIIDAPLGWSSSNPAVATVNQSGLILGSGSGTTTIVASSGAVTGSADVTVTAVSGLASLALSPDVTTIGVGGTQRFAVTARDANGVVVTVVPLAWSSSDLTVATVTPEGGVRGVSSGRATITASVPGTSLTASAMLDVVAGFELTTFRVTVLDSGPRHIDPTQNVRVLLNNPVTGALIGDKRTDASGVADFGNIGMTRATLSIISEESGHETATFLNIPGGDFTVSDVIDHSSLATTNVTLNNLPTGTTMANVFSGGFNGGGTGGFSSSSATINGFAVDQLQADLKFSVLGQAHDQNGGLLACGFLADLDPFVADHTTVTMNVTTAPLLFSFSSTEPVVLRFREVLRKAVVFDIFQPSSAAAVPVLSGDFKVCPLPGAEKAQLEFATPETATVAARRISRIFAVPTASPPLSNLRVPDLAITNLSRLGSTISWTPSGTDLGQLDFAVVQLAWRSGTNRMGWFLVADPATTTSITLPLLPADLADRVPPPSGVGFRVQLGGLGHVNGFQDLGQRLSESGGRFDEVVKFGATETIEVVRSSPVVSVRKTGNGTGTVTSSPPGINCGATCTAHFEPGTTVTLTAAADPGSTTQGIFGQCRTTTQTTCVIELSDGQEFIDVTANFERGN